MGWKEKSGTITFPLFKYLEEHGFYESKMSPRFMQSAYDNIKFKGVSCMRHDSGFRRESDEYTLRIFVSRTEAYVEIQTPWRSMEYNAYAELPENCSIEQLNEILDRLTDYDLYV